MSTNADADPSRPRAPEPGIDLAAVRAFIAEGYGFEPLALAFNHLNPSSGARTWRISGDGGEWLLKLFPGGTMHASLWLLLDLERSGICRVAPPVVRRDGLIAAPFPGLPGSSAALFKWIEGRAIDPSRVTLPQWRELGAMLRTLHGSGIAPRYAGFLYSPELALPETALAAVRDAAASEHPASDEVQPLVAALREHLPRIEAAAAEGRRLLVRLSGREFPATICHGDLGWGNVIAGADGALRLIDWHCSHLAPAEYDLAHFESRILIRPGDDAASHAFLAGYAPAPRKIDLELLTFFRLARVLEWSVVPARAAFAATAANDPAAGNLRAIAIGNLTRYVPELDLLAALATDL